MFLNIANSILVESIPEWLESTFWENWDMWINTDEFISINFFYWKLKTSYQFYTWKVQVFHHNFQEDDFLDLYKISLSDGRVYVIYMDGEWIFWNPTLKEKISSLLN